MFKLVNDEDSSTSKSSIKSNLSLNDIGNSINSYNNNEVKKCSLPLRVIGVQENSCIAFTPDNNRFAFISGNGSIYITKESDHSFEIENVLVGHTHHVNCLLFHPTQPVLVSGGFDGIIIWDYIKGFIIKKIGTHKDQDSHDSKVETLTWLYDGTSLASGSKDSTIKIWDFIKGDYHLLETISAHKAPVTCFNFCKNSGLLASAGRDSSVKVWDVSTLQPEQRSKRSDDSSIKVALYCTLDGHMGDVVSMVFNKDGSMLFSGARDNEIKVWDVKKQEEIRSIKFNKGEVTSMELLSKDSILLTSSIDGSIKSIKLAKATSVGVNDVLQIEELAKEAQIIENNAISGNTLSLGPSSISIDDIGLGDLSIGLDNEKDKILYSYEPYDSVGISSMCISQNGAFMATSSDRSVRIWKLLPNNYTDKPTLFHEFVGHRGPVNSVFLLANSELLISGSTDYNIFIYNLKTMRREAVFNFEGSVYTLCVAKKDNQTIVFVGGNHYDIKGYCIQSNENEQLMREVIRFSGHSGKVQAVAISPDSTFMVSGGHDFDILVWQIKIPYHYRGGDEHNQLQKPLNKHSFHKGHITSLSFNHNGKYLASCATDHSIVVWECSSSNKKISRFITIEQAHQSVVSSVAFGSNQSQQYFFSASWDGIIKVWDLSNPKKTSKSINDFKAHNSRISSIKVSDDGELLIAAFSDGHLKTFSTLRPWNLVAEYTPNDNTSCNCISSNSSIIVSGSDNGMIRCWPINIGNNNDNN
ncbi:hypothetical protein DICPUDRAFT_55281 [Dictyostelium purpureum]|uniref:Uncharacterized protein n=1 Tax=Dictyostelium purpureum TaxID=5786 RepID=F0ZLB6_DICPU|nr:uncharacterized protein DICPUDRAFT_55281 [Dictyostelium purpureum]EGC35285.1 hypothetical protein DICPUDRAFT_55281 [Dictyostelium purpureum]|eukprot:XP_003288211.1 hypothetical protein DICPUDRAFT_55281 [Dictyostelium purpureum]